MVIIDSDGTLKIKPGIHTNPCSPDLRLTACDHWPSYSGIASLTRGVQKVLQLDTLSNKLKIFYC